MTISLIVAIAENGVIGRTGVKIPWRLSADIARFKSLTTDHSIIMGRKTYETFLRPPLPHRQNIVVTGDASFFAPGCDIASSLSDALAVAKSEEIFVIGGAELFKQALPLASKIYLTTVRAKPTGDTIFSFDESGWRRISEESYPADDKNEIPYTFITLERTRL